MGKWRNEERKRLALALHQQHWTYPEMARKLGNRDMKQCKSHLQKVAERFRYFHSCGRPTEDQQTVYSSYLLYLTNFPISPSPNETPMPVNRRPTIQLDEPCQPEHDETELDFLLTVGDLWTTTSTSTHGNDLF